MFRISVSHYPTCLQMPSACHGLVMAAGCEPKHRPHTGTARKRSMKVLNTPVGLTYSCASGIPQNTPQKLEAEFEQKLFLCFLTGEEESLFR